MPVTAGHVPGMTSGLRRVPMDPGRFHSGRWFLLAEGVLVSVFGVVGLVFAALHPHAENSRALVSGLASTPLHSAILLAFGVLAIAAVPKRRAAVIVTALSAVGYTILLFFSSVGAARTTPTPAASQSAGILLHGVLAVVNLALLMWLIPDELGDEAWARRRRGRERDRCESAPAPISTVSADNPAPTAASAARQPAAERAQPILTGTTGDDEQPSNSEQAKPVPVRTPAAARSRAGVLTITVLAAVVVGLVIWMRRR